MSAYARLRIAAAAEASGDTELAASMSAAAAEEAPSNTQAQLNYAGLLLRAGKVGPAKDLLIRRLATSSDPVEIRQALAQIYLLSGQPENAIAELDKVLSSQPRDLRALANKGVALDLMGRHSEAQTVYAQARSIAPNDPAIANDLALSLALQGRVREAQDVLAPWKDAENAPERLKTNLGLLFQASGDAAQARQLLGDRVNDREVASLAHAIPVAAGTSAEAAARPRLAAARTTRSAE
jgi:Flp pilus assembly protein TadD